MPTGTHEVFARHIRAPFGMVLCAGPTGSWQDHDPVCRADRDRRSKSQHHDHRGPGRVRVPLDQPDPDQRAGRDHLRQRSAVHPAPGPRRHPRRRDPRRGNGTDRRAVGPDRAPRALLAARHRLGRSTAPIPGHGHRVLPRRIVGRGRRQPTPGATDVSDVQGDRTTPRTKSSPSTKRVAACRRTSSSRARAATSVPAPGTRTASACSS